MTSSKYPNVTVELEDGNAYAIISKVSRALQREVSIEASNEFRIKASTSSDYDALLRLALSYVDVELI